MLSGAGNDGPQLLQKSFLPPCKHSPRDINNPLIQLTISQVTDWTFQSQPSVFDAWMSTSKDLYVYTPLEYRSPAVTKYQVVIYCSLDASDF